ncbi:MAG: tyrosine-type recombinase/integrase [Chloroflexi bacterium]|nr:tyrosine-type recombinase/integrase [Chloroflexota bacterium]
MQTQRIIEYSNKEKSLSNLVDGFLLERKSRGLQERSIEFYRGKLKHFIEWADKQGVKNIDDVTPAMLRAFLLYLEESKHRRGGIHAFYRTLRAFLKWYQSEFEPAGWLNPLRKVQSPKVPTEPLDPVSLDDVRALLAVCHGKRFTADRDRAIILTLLDTGARAGELLRIDFADCNSITGDILIRKGKGSKPRTVFVGRMTRRALRSYLKLRDDTSPALFVSDNGERLSYDGLRAIMTRRAKLAGIRPPKLQGYRRAFAVNMLRAGVDAVSISRLLGHGDLQMILKYVKQNSDDLRDVHGRASPADKL